MNIVIVGKGTMGSGISRMLKRHGFIPKNINIRSTIPPATDLLKSIESADLILECVAENEAAKFEVLSFCANRNSKGLIASCTSSLSINLLQTGVNNPERFLGIHFMNPPVLIPYVEVIIGDQTSESNVAKALEWLESIGRIVSFVPDLPGFAINAILFAMLNRAAYFLEASQMASGAVDDLLVGVCGHKLGPLATLDLIGMDVALTILINLNEREPKLNLPPAPIIKKLVEQGHLGKKSKQGFYTYSS